MGNVAQQKPSPLNLPIGPHNQVYLVVQGKDDVADIVQPTDQFFTVKTVEQVQASWGGFGPGFRQIWTVVPPSELNRDLKRIVYDPNSGKKYRHLGLAALRAKLAETLQRPLPPPLALVPNAGTVGDDDPLAKWVEQRYRPDELNYQGEVRRLVTLARQELDNRTTEPQTRTITDHLNAVNGYHPSFELIDVVRAHLGDGPLDEKLADVWIAAIELQPEISEAGVRRIAQSLMPAVGSENSAQPVPLPAPAANTQDVATVGLTGGQSDSTDPPAEETQPASESSDTDKPKSIAEALEKFYNRTYWPTGARAPEVDRALAAIQNAGFDFSNVTEDRQRVGWHIRAAIKKHDKSAKPAPIPQTSGKAKKSAVRIAVELTLQPDGSYPKGITTMRQLIKEIAKKQAVPGATKKKVESAVNNYRCFLRAKAKAAQGAAPESSPGEPAPVSDSPIEVVESEAPVVLDANSIEARAEQLRNDYIRAATAYRDAGTLKDHILAELNRIRQEWEQVPPLVASLPEFNGGVTIHKLLELAEQLSS